jgi:hypothetical protein
MKDHRQNEHLFFVAVGVLGVGILGGCGSGKSDDCGCVLAPNPWSPPDVPEPDAARRGSTGPPREAGQSEAGAGGDDADANAIVDAGADGPDDGAADTAQMEVDL